MARANTSPPAFELEWGSFGTGPGEFEGQLYAAVSPNGHVYVAGFETPRVQVFDANGNYILEWGSSGTGDGQFLRPIGIAVDNQGFVYVTDDGRRDVQKFDSTGNFIRSWGGQGSANGQFQGPAGIDVDSGGNVFVIDYALSRVQKFDASGNYLTQWSVPGSFPFGLAIAPSGHVLVTNLFNGTVVKYDPDGTFVTQWGTFGSGDGEFRTHWSLDVDSDGTVYVADLGNDRVQVFDASGNYLTQWGSPGSAPGEFDQPSDIAVDASGNIFVVDQLNYRIQKFAYENPNGPPEVTSVSADLDPAEVGADVDATATFIDADDLDHHTAEWDWGDGSTSAGTVDHPTNSVSGSHSYSTPGVYTVSVTVTDPDSDADPNSDTASATELVVVYDPNGGFVTGGGWIDAPAGAFVADPDLSGKATFGFVAKYQQGQSTPSGNTEFHFKAGDLRFKSNADYMWLVVSGSGHKATYKGSGTVNGQGNYGFMVTAIDAANTNSTDDDLFRIKIWDADASDAAIYDNHCGNSGEDADPCTALGGGNIKIHKP